VIEFYDFDERGRVRQSMIAVVGVVSAAAAGSLYFYYNSPVGNGTGNSTAGLAGNADSTAVKPGTPEKPAEPAAKAPTEKAAKAPAQSTENQPAQTSSPATKPQAAPSAGAVVKSDDTGTRPATKTTKADVPAAPAKPDSGMQIAAGPKAPTPRPPQTTAAVTPPTQQTGTKVTVAVAPPPKAAPEPSSKESTKLKSTTVAVASPPDPAKTPKAADDTPMRTAVATPPSFDLVRVSSDCTAVIAGRAMSDSVIYIFLGGDKIAEAHADRRGEWVLVMDDPLPSGTLELSVSARVADGPAVDGTRNVVMVVPDCRLPQLERGTRMAVLTPNKGPKQGGTTTVLQEPTKGNADGKGAAAKPSGLSVGSVDYDEKGNMALSGTGKPGGRVQAYVNNRYVGRANTDAHGSWRVVPERQVDPGVHRLRVDQVDRTGTVLARIELPFSRAAPAKLAMLEDRVIVQPGNSLWRIARHTYGQGVHYSVIYQANQDQIADADLIYPGQIFILPTR
jgi:hypothetical protein